MDSSSPSLDLGISSVSVPLDLSKATNLKKVVFQIERPSVRWITVVLQTVRSMNLRWIIIRQAAGLHGTAGVEKELFPEWQDLDILLVQRSTLDLAFDTPDAG